MTKRHRPRRSFQSPGGRVSVRWRREVGLPLIVVGTLMAYTVADVEGGGVFFWVGAVIAGIGVAVFFAGRFSR